MTLKYVLQLQCQFTQSNYSTPIFWGSSINDVTPIFFPLLRPFIYVTLLCCNPVLKSLASLPSRDRDVIYRRFLINSSNLQLHVLRNEIVKIVFVFCKKKKKKCFEIDVVVVNCANFYNIVQLSPLFYSLNSSERLLVSIL